MTRISDLSQDLIEEILSRVPLTSQRAARSTCKQWNRLYKDKCFTKKHRGKAANDTMMIRVCNSRACLVSVDLHGVRKQKNGLFELSTEPIGQLNHITASDVYHCDGLLLCLHKKGMVKSDTVVWNPYLGQARWIKPSKFFSKFDRYCLGYDNKNNHKILRVLHLTPDWIIPYKGQGGLSLKGNTYFVAREGLGMREYVICFDFTKEQLAVLFYREDTNAIEIRITRKIEANEESWRTFLKVDVQPFMLSGMFSISPPCRSFFVDEKKKVAIICDNHFRRAYMIGEDNYFKLVAQGKTTQWPVVCSYVPSSVQIPK
ncbi:unnamed protein product, partial [Brassica rapa subsp. trilocularis]